MSYASAPPPPAPPTVVERPGIVTAAGITLIVLGILTLVLGLFLLVGVGLFAGAAGSIPESQVPAAPAMFGAVAGMILVILVIVAAFGIVQLVSGIRVLGGRSWARWAGIVVSAIAGLFALAGLAGNEGGSVVLNLVLAGANAFAIWALASSGSWFAVRSAA